MHPARPPLHALTGVRFLAAMLVVFFHYMPKDLPAPLENAVRNGHLAVGLFFVLSGFVLAYNYAGRPVNSRRFWLARFARIYPAYLLAFLLIAPAVIYCLRGNPLRLAASGLAAGTFLQGWIPGLELMWNAPGWSLSNEAFFYLLFPMLLPQLESLSRRGLWVGAGICAIAGVAADDVWKFFPLFRLPQFVLGIIAGLIFLRHRVRIPLLPAAVAFVAFLMVPPDALGMGVRNAIGALLSAVFLSALATHSAFLSSPKMTQLGEASYALYILQSPLMAYFLVALQGVSAVSSRTQLTWTQFGLYTGVLLAASLACFYWLEVPARRWILKSRRGAQHLKPIAVGD